MSIPCLVRVTTSLSLFRYCGAVSDERFALWQVLTDWMSSWRPTEKVRRPRVCMNANVHFQKERCLFRGLTLLKWHTCCRNDAERAFYKRAANELVNKRISTQRVHSYIMCSCILIWRVCSWLFITELCAVPSKKAFNLLPRREGNKMTPF